MGGNDMPYVDEQRKTDLDWGDVLPENPGDLNYVFSDIIDGYLERKGLRYEHVNAIVGALECCKMELYRRIAAPYENQKIKENGDVYRTDLVRQADPNGCVVAPASNSDVSGAILRGGQPIRIADH